MRNSQSFDKLLNKIYPCLQCFLQNSLILFRKTEVYAFKLQFKYFKKILNAVSCVYSIIMIANSSERATCKSILQHGIAILQYSSQKNIRFGFNKKAPETKLDTRYIRQSLRLKAPETKLDTRYIRQSLRLNIVNNLDISSLSIRCLVNFN